MTYWILEYIKTACVYFLAMYLWPYLVFYPYLKNKSRTFCFAFCSLSSVLLCNALVMVLGLLHLLHGWILTIVFYAVPVYLLFQRTTGWKNVSVLLKRAAAGSIHARSFFARLFEPLFLWNRERWKISRERNKGHHAEYILLGVILAFLMLYYAWTGIHDIEYGTTDLYTHHSWIDALAIGRIFAGGIAPEAMHCFAYLLHEISGVCVYSILKFLGPVHACTTLIAMYVLAREVLHWKYAALASVLLFGIFKPVSVETTAAIARLQWTLPQEFAFCAELLAGTFLLRYLHQRREEALHVFHKEIRIDENLLILTGAIAAVLSCSFTSARRMMLLCAGIVIACLPKLLHKTKIMPLLKAVLASFVIAFLPMLLAMLEGFFRGDSLFRVNAAAAVAQSEGISWFTLLKNWMYEYSFGITAGSLLFWLSFILLLCFLVSLILTRFVKGRTVEELKQQLCMDSAIVIALLLGELASFASLFHLPSIIDAYSMYSAQQFYGAVVLLMPLDMAAFFLRRMKDRTLATVLGTALQPLVYAVVILTGSFHSYLFSYGSRYEQAVQMTNAIIRSRQKYSFTIVSPKDEYYQVVNDGYHEEMIAATNNCTKEHYTLPSEYVYLFIEKQPLVYAQTHFVTGPEWLAANTQLDYFENGTSSSVAPEMLHTEISAEDAVKPPLKADYDMDAASDPDMRTIMESQMYAWYEKLDELYGNHVSVVYEDDAFLCVEIRQNPDRLLELAVMGN